MSLKASYFFDLREFPHAEIFAGLEYPWLALQLLNTYIKSLELGPKQGEISTEAHLINSDQIYIGEGTIVEPGAYIRGPCWIGKKCVIRHGAYIRGNVLTGDHCVIGHSTEVKNSIFLNKAQAAHFAYLGDTILGSHVNLGAGTRCANLKLNHKPITVELEGQQLIATEMRKLGAIVGDYCQIGCNSVLNPGTLMGKEVKCYPCLNVGGWIPARSLIKPAHKAVIIPII